MFLKMLLTRMAALKVFQGPQKNRQRSTGVEWRTGNYTNIGYGLEKEAIGAVGATDCLLKMGWEGRWGLY